MSITSPLENERSIGCPDVYGALARALYNVVHICRGFQFLGWSETTDSPDRSLVMLVHIRDCEGSVLESFKFLFQILNVFHADEGYTINHVVKSINIDVQRIE